MIATQGRLVKIDKSNLQLTRLSSNDYSLAEERPTRVQAPAGSLVKEDILDPKPKLIMVFGNTKDLRRIIQLSLEEIAGWQVFVANLDSQDLTLVTVIQPDVILLDTNLPDSDELGILQKIQEYPDIQDIPIVLLTERIFNNDRKFYQSLGIVAAIAKPCDMVTLARLISQRLNWNWHRF